MPSARARSSSAADELDRTPRLLGVALPRHRRDADEAAVAVDDDRAVRHADVQQLVNGPIARDGHQADELLEERHRVAGLVPADLRR